MTELAIATYAGHPDLTDDDALLGEALIRIGITWTAVPWDAPDTDWSGYDAVLIRSTWDYHEKAEAFFIWAAQLEASGTPLWNSAATVRRNGNKMYLRELEQAGVATVPTFWIVQGAERPDVRSIATEQGWSEIIAKPAVSAGGRGLLRWAVSSDGAPDDALSELAAGSDVLIQPFLPQIRSGEWSFVFFDGALSHVVRKTPGAGDYRVQAKFGGGVERVDPPVELIEQAWRAASLAGADLYARVDGIPLDGKLVVMEVELIEPDLFFHVAPEAASTLAAAIRHRMALLTNAT
jgi:glutathione synthase/RimK-type ligase-like ATP-grasp enzyme